MPHKVPSGRKPARGPFREISLGKARLLRGDSSAADKIQEDQVVVPLDKIL